MVENEKQFSFEEFVAIHESQLVASGVPPHFWNPLYTKLMNESLDAGNSMMMVVDNETSHWSVFATQDIRVDDPNNIFLIDHAWTFRPNGARRALLEIPGLKERLIEAFNLKEECDEIMSVSEYFGSESGDAKHDDKTIEGDNGSLEGEEIVAADKIIDIILVKIWQYAQTYTVKLRKETVDDNDLPVWYIPDEFGLRIGHSREPNFKVVPFYYIFQNISYSLLFPLVNVDAEQEVTRNYVDTRIFYDHPNWYDVLMLPWKMIDLSENEVGHQLKGDEYYSGGREADELPSDPENAILIGGKSIHDVFKVYAPNTQLIDNLKEIKVELVDDLYSADIIWMSDHFHNFKKLAEVNPGAKINQFPYESTLTVKDLFASVVQEVYGGTHAFDSDKLEWKPEWFPASYNLNYELPEFVAYFQKRQKKDLPNVWIVKPWNLARGLDIHISRNLSCIVRLAESGPKLASKYIENPILFCRPDNGNMVKFDLRFIVFLRALEPELELAVYNKFWIRLAVNEFSLANLDDTYTHFTVHNYTDKEKIYNIKCEDFIEQLQKLYPQLNWTEVQKQINDVIREVFSAVITHPRGIPPNRQSRAMYGLDMMLYWKDSDQKEIGVTFLETNFAPDCERACQYYEDFADTVFKTLFIDESFDGNKNVVWL